MTETEERGVAGVRVVMKGVRVGMKGARVVMKGVRVVMTGERVGMKGVRVVIRGWWRIRLSRVMTMMVTVTMMVMVTVTMTVITTRARHSAVLAYGVHDCGGGDDDFEITMSYFMNTPLRKLYISGGFNESYDDSFTK